MRNNAERAFYSKQAIRESEADFSTWVEDLMHRFGYTLAHFRPARTEKGWRTPVSCDGKDFPDYICVGPELRDGNRRHLVIEIKSEDGEIRPGQVAWLDLFNAVEGTEVFLLRPSDRDEFEQIVVLGHVATGHEMRSVKSAWKNRREE